MAKNTSKDLAIIKPDNVSSEIKMELDKNDIVTYQVAKIEQRLEKEEKELVNQMNDAQKKVDTAEKFMRNLIKGLEKKKSPYEAAIARVNNEIKKITNDKDFIYKVTFEDVAIDEKTGKKVLYYKARSEHSYHSIKLKPVPAPASINAAEKKVSAANSVVADLLEKLSTVRTKLANVGKMERRAKAAMTEKILQNSKLGQTLLLAEAEV